MAYLFFAGVVSFIFGILILFAPQSVRNLSSKVNKWMNSLSVPIDEKVYQLRVGVGVSLILAAVLFFFVFYCF